MTRYRKVAYLSLAVLTCLSITFVYISFSAGSRGLLKVTVLNVGQGDAIFIEAPNGAQFIVDGGPGDALSSELQSVMPFFDRSIDGIMITNPDTDHYEGFLSMLRRYKVGIAIEAGTVSRTPAYAALERSIAEHGLKRVLARRGMRIVLDSASGVYIEVLFPDRDVSTLATNDGSIIARLVYGETVMLLQGDAPRKIEEYLLSLDRGGLDADVLKIGHHGSKTSTLKEYVEAVSPRYAVASLGAGNRYGHPHQETLDTLRAFGLSLLRTDIDGSISFVSDGKTFERR